MCMIWKEVIEKYGENNAEKMSHSRYLQGCTCEARDGELDFYDSDIEMAYEDMVLQRKIHSLMWD